MFHPNIDASGKLVIRFLELPPANAALSQGYWSPSITVSALIERVLHVLEEPEPGRFVNQEAGDLFRIPMQDEYRERVLATSELTYQQQQRNYFEENESVKALPRHTTSLAYLPATITKVRDNGRYDVRFADGTVEANCAKVSALSFVCGELIRARWKKRKVFYPGRIVGRYGTAFAIRYDDGDFESNVEAERIISAPTFALCEPVLIEVGKKLQLGEVCRLHPNSIFYDVLVGGKLFAGKFIVPASGTHLEPAEIEWSKNQKIELLNAKPINYLENPIFAPFTTWDSGKIVKLDKNEMSLQLGETFTIDLDIARDFLQTESAPTVTDSLLSTKEKHERYAFQVNDIVDCRFKKHNLLRCKIIAIGKTENQKPTDSCTLEFEISEATRRGKDYGYLEYNLGGLTLVCPHDAHQDYRAMKHHPKPYHLCPHCKARIVAVPVTKNSVCPTCATSPSRGDVAPSHPQSKAKESAKTPSSKTSPAVLPNDTPSQPEGFHKRPRADSTANAALEKNSTCVPPKKKWKFGEGSDGSADSNEDKAKLVERKAPLPKQPKAIPKEKKRVEKMDVDKATISEPNRVNNAPQSLPIINDVEAIQATPNPLGGHKPEKLDPSLFEEKDLGELTDIIYLQQLRIFALEEQLASLLGKKL